MIINNTMKNTMLKIAKMKDEASFYKAFPDEESFMKVHGKAFKKAMLGAKITSAANGNILQGISNRVDPALQGLNYQQGQNIGMPQQLGYENLLGQQQDLSGNLMSSPSIQQSASFIPSAKIGEGNSIGGNNILGSLGKMINPAEKLAQGISSLIQEGKQRKKAEQWEDVSDLQLQASMTQPEQSKRNYVRPEDMMVQYDQVNNTNVLGKNGISIKKKAANGFSDIMNAGGTDIANNLISRTFNNNAGYQIGSSVGDAVSMIPGVGPVIGAIASPVLGAIGGVLDPNLRKTKRAQENTYRNIENMAFSKGIQKQYTSFMEDGGNLNPQVIKKFGNFDMSNLRTGGNIRQNEVFPQDRFAMGGELQAYQGEIEPISHNPYLPDGGETVMFRGPSHEEGGMDITYGKNPVEVEGNEPAVKLEDGGGTDNLVVFGNLPIPKFGKALLGDKDATGKFKNYIANLSKKEEKANKVISSSTGKIGEVDMNNSFDKLTLASHKANIYGADKQLQEIADKKTKASILQEAMNIAKNSPTAKDGKSMDKLPLQEFPDPSGWVSRIAKDNFPQLSQYPNLLNGIELASEFTGIPGMIRYISGEDQSPDAVMSMIPGVGAINKMSKLKSMPSRFSKEYEDLSKIADKAYDLENNAQEAINANRMARELKSKSLPSNKSNAYSTLSKDVDEAEKLAYAQNKDIPTGNNNLFNLGVGGVGAGIIGLGVFGNNNKSTKSKKQTVVQDTIMPHNNPYLNVLGNNRKYDEGGNVNPYDPWIYNTNRQSYDVNNPFRIQGFSPNTLSVVTNTSVKNPNIGRPSIVPIVENTTNKQPYGKSLPQEYPVNNLITRSTTEMSKLPTNYSVGDTRSENEEDTNKFPWLQLINSALPYFRPSDAENLNARQLMGESFALSNNQLEPVQAQTYNPQLDNAYTISLDDIRNENQADYRAAQRMMGGNPAAQAILNAQKYAANQKVGGEEFRLNQALKDKVFSGNRATLNDAQLKNLGIYDNQYTRQEQAKANTKGVTQAALNSISDKHLKNQLENRTLQAYENLYNYRYDNQGRVINMNPLFTPNIPTVGSTSQSGIVEKDGKQYRPIDYDNKTGLPIKYELIPTSETKTKVSTKNRNGGIVKAFRNL